MTPNSHPNDNVASPSANDTTAFGADDALATTDATAAAGTDNTNAAKETAADTTTEANDNDVAMENAEPPFYQAEVASPSTWAEIFDPAFLPVATNNIDADKLVPANIHDSINAVSIRAERSPELAILSSSSGKLNATVLLHNLMGISSIE